MRNVLIALMLLGMLAILVAMWVAFPTMLIANIVVTVIALMWGVWLAHELKDK